MINVDNNASLNKGTTQSDGTVGQSGANSPDCMPAPLTDDIRNIMPAVGDDIANNLAAEVKAIEAQLPTLVPDVGPLIEGVDFGLAKAPDLSKVIPKLDAFGRAGAPIGLDAFGGSAQALAAAGNAQGIVNSAASKAQNAAANAVNNASNAANNAIGNASNAAKSKVSKLLGG